MITGQAGKMNYREFLTALCELVEDAEVHVRVGDLKTAYNIIEYTNNFMLRNQGNLSFDNEAKHDESKKL